MLCHLEPPAPLQHDPAPTDQQKIEKDVTELVKSLNIQFDNLCQFLPQDKVVEFARLDPYELLIATQKAIGDASLYDMHQELIAKRNKVKQDVIVSGRGLLCTCVGSGWCAASFFISFLCFIHVWM
jgi:hypothetical protein